VADEFTGIHGWIKRQGDLGLGQLFSARRSCSLKFVLADEPIRAGESMSVLRLIAKVPQTEAFVATLSSGAMDGRRLLGSTRLHRCAALVSCCAD
jgi:hypothetical protein